MLRFDFQRIPAVKKKSGSMTKKSLSIVVLTLNRPTLLEKSLESVFRYTQVPFELVVLDNGSSDVRVHEYLDNLVARYPGQVSLIKSKVNIGCGIGRATALEQASGETLCTLDSDMCVTPGWDVALLERLYESDDIGATSAKISNPDNHLFSNGGSCRRLGSSFVHLENVDFGKSLFDRNLAGKHDCDWIPAGAMVMRRTAYEQNPYSHRRYKNCMVEINVGFKMRRNGWRLVNCPDSLTYHFSDHLEKDQQEEYFSIRRSASVFCQSTLYFEDDFGVNPVTSWDCPRHYLGMQQPTLLELHAFFADLRTHLHEHEGVVEKQGVKLYLEKVISDFLEIRKRNS